MVSIGLRFEISRPPVVDEAIDDEVVMINMDTGVYYGLRQTAAAVWSGIDAGASVTEIVAEIDAAAGNTTGDLTESVTTFVDQLVDEGLVKPRDIGEAAPWSISQLPPFDPPVLEKFTDLKNLLLLDPVHDVDAEGWPHVKEG